MTKKGISFMAVARGSESKEIEVKRYIGVAALEVLAVNPSRAELNKIYGSSSSDDEIVYTGETTAKDANGNEIKVPQVRISIVCKTDPAIACNNGIDTIVPINFFLSKAYNYSTKNGVVKVQVIDRYGRTGWVTSEELKSHAIPEYTIKKGPKAGQTMKANLDKMYRPAFIGEENLVKFIIAFVNIPRPDVWSENDNTYVMKTDPKELSESECMLDNIQKYFEGNVKELKEIVTFQPKNRFKIALGVRTTQNGSQYQCAYTSLPMKLAVQNFKPLETALEEDRKVGRHPSEEYVAQNLTEYTVSPTSYAKTDSPASIDPFASASAQPVDGEGTQMPMDVDPFGAM